MSGHTRIKPKLRLYELVEGVMRRSNNLNKVKATLDLVLKGGEDIADDALEVLAEEADPKDDTTKARDSRPRPRRLRAPERTIVMLSFDQ